MNIKSLYLQNNTGNLKEVFEVRGKLEKIIAISAYTDIDTINELVTYAKKKAYAGNKIILQIFIDSSSSRFFSNIKLRNYYVKENKKISKLFSNNSGIYLVNSGKLFHSKLYLLEGKKKGKILIGSMNLTKNGIRNNEEILFVHDYNIYKKKDKLSSWVDQYVSLLLEISFLVNKKQSNCKLSTLRQLLINGSIYYELKEQSPFNFRLYLPENISNIETNIDSMLESTISNTLSIEKLISSSKSNGGLGKKIIKKKKSRSLWKKFCMETCYGFWSPKYLHDDLKKSLKKRNKSRAPYYKSMRKIIENERDDITKKFLLLCERINVYLLEKNIQNWKYSDIDHAEESWDKWYDILLEKMDNVDFYNRLILGISSVPCPDVWNDPLSSQELEDSFCKEIYYQWSKEYSKETTNVIAKTIYWNLEVLDSNIKYFEDPIELKKFIEIWFEEYPEMELIEFNDYE